MSEPAKIRPMIDLDEFERRLRQPSAPKTTEDPLAELARLVGQGKDPFRDVFAHKAPAAPAVHQPHYDESYAAPQPVHQGPRAVEDWQRDEIWDERHEPHFGVPAHHPVGANIQAIEQGLRGSLDADPYAPQPDPAHYYNQQPQQHQPQPPVQEPWLADERYPDNYQPQAQANPSAYAETPPAYMDAPAYAEDDYPQPKSRKKAYIAAAAIGALLLGVGGTMALKGKGGNSNQLATIIAPSGPVKVQPSTPGGVDVPNKDASLLDKSTPPTVTKVISRDEQPVDLSQAAQKGTRVISMNGNNAAVPPAGGAAAVAVPQPPVMPYSITNFLEPRKVKTVSVRPDGTVIQNDNPPAAAQPSPPSRPAQIKEANAAPTPKLAKPKNTARVVTTPKPEASAVENGNGPMQLNGAKPKRVASAEVANDTVASTGNGAYAVQLAGAGTDAEAKETAARLAKKYGDALGGRRPSVRKAEVGDKTIYRVRVSGLSQADANTLCTKLKSSGGACFVAKN